MLGPKYWCLPTFKLFFLTLNFTSFSFIASGKINKCILFHFDLHFRLFEMYGQQPSKECCGCWVFYSLYCCSALRYSYSNCYVGVWKVVMDFANTKWQVANILGVSEITVAASISRKFVCFPCNAQSSAWIL